MKFGQLLRQTADDLPEITCLFNTYKQLKKQLKKLPDKSHMQDEGAVEKLTEEEAAFVSTIDKHLANMNNMFLDKEEEAVIRLEALQAAAAAAQADHHRRKLYKQLVDFHGEVLLLVHWSALAYTATVKILKKHHKRTGLLLRAPHLENLLSQPFCSTELMNQLANKAEECVRDLARALHSSSATDSTLTVTTPTDLTKDAAAGSTDAEQQSAPSAPSAAAATTAAPSNPDAASGQLPGHRQRRAAVRSGSSAQPLDTLNTQGVGVQGSGDAATLSAAASGSDDPQGLVLEDSLEIDDSDEEDVSQEHLQALNGLMAVGKRLQENCETMHAALGGASSAAAAPAPISTSGAASDTAPVLVTASCDSGLTAGAAVSGEGAAAGSMDLGSAIASNNLKLPRRAAPLVMDMLRRTQVALDTWSKLRATASTPSTVLPPDAAPPCATHAGTKRCHSAALCDEGVDEVDVPAKSPRQQA